MRRIIGGVVAGLMGASLYICTYQLVGTLLGSTLVTGAAPIWPVTTAFIAAAYLASTLFCLVFAFVFDKLPGSLLVRVGIIYVISLAGELLLGFPSAVEGAHAMSAGVTGLITFALAFAVYAVVVGFILRQVIELPLPSWAPLRRSDTFKDIREELH